MTNYCVLGQSSDDAFEDNINSLWNGLDTIDQIIQLIRITDVSRSLAEGCEHCLLVVLGDVPSAFKNFTTTRINYMGRYLRS